MTKLSTDNLNSLISNYRADLAAACRQGKTLRDTETREGWGYFKTLLAEKARRAAIMRAAPHLYN